MESPDTYPKREVPKAHKSFFFFFESSPFAVSHTWIWIWVIKIQIPCFDSLQKVKNLDLTNPSRILNLKILEFEITFKPIEF